MKPTPNHKNHHSPVTVTRLTHHQTTQTTNPAQTTQPTPKPKIIIKHQTSFRPQISTLQEPVQHLVNPTQQHNTPGAQVSRFLIILDTQIDYTHPIPNFTFNRPVGVLEFTAPNGSGQYADKRAEQFAQHTNTYTLPLKGRFICEAEGSIVFVPVLKTTSNKPDTNTNDTEDDYDNPHTQLLPLPYYSKFYHITEVDIEIDDHTLDADQLPFIEHIRPTVVRKRYSVKRTEERR